MLRTRSRLDNVIFVFGNEYDIVDKSCGISIQIIIIIRHLFQIPNKYIIFNKVIDSLQRRGYDLWCYLRGSIKPFVNIMHLLCLIRLFPLGTLNKGEAPRCINYSITYDSRPRKKSYILDMRAH